MPTKLEQLLQRLEENMIHIARGTFQMGSNERKDEQPIHPVTVPDFYLSRYLVTNEDFLPFLLEKGNQTEGRYEWVDLEGSYQGAKCGIRAMEDSFALVVGLEKHPMIYVSWYGANAYCQWLSQKTGKSYQLPSEAMWEYAARGGRHHSPCQYAGGNKLKEVGWYNDNSHNSTQLVGKKLPNELGIYDMSGNVWEWCADNWHENYEDAPADGSVWININNDMRVLRGGSWLNVTALCRVSSRGRLNPSDRNNYLGFRVSRAYPSAL